MRANRFMLITVFSATILFFVLWQTAVAGPPEKPGNPGVPGLLAEIAELEDMLDQLQYFAPVPQTGQTVILEPGDDGHLEKGVAWPDPRFTDNEDGTVTDNLTRLIWLKNANCDGAKTWANALAFANSLHDGWTGDGSGGDCGLIDNSSAGDWRLPNVKELQSLVDYGRYNPTFPEIHPFAGVVAGRYWSSTTYDMYTLDAWRQNFYFGDTNHDSKGEDFYVWPVRGGN